MAQLTFTPFQSHCISFEKMNIQCINRCSRCLRSKTVLFHRNSLNVRRIECSRYQQTSSTSVDKVVIPERINRSPTDILEALASTVSRDFTAPHYKFLDDPYLIPKSHLDVRSYALSKESGRKAARYFLDNYPELFFRDAAEPKVPAFSFKELYDETTDVNEDDLRGRIQENDVSNSIIAYNNLKTKGITLDKETTQNLLELVCFFNSSEPPDENFSEEMWFQNTSSDIIRRNWKDSDFAEQLFNDINEKSASTYITLLLGYTKHFQSQKAFKLHEEMISQNIPLTLEAYNGLIRNICGVKESGESRWDLINHLLIEMNGNKVRPDVNTFNACLFVLSHSASWIQAVNFALGLISEMKRLNIRPSLASYYFLITITMYRKKENLTVLYEIVNELEGKPFVLKHKNDANFLELAMKVCSQYLSDVELGYRIHNLLSIGNNHKFFDGAKSESNYYRFFFNLISLCDSSDNLFNVYNKYVPNIYMPEPTVFVEILKNIELHGAYGYVPQLYSDIVSINSLFRGNVAQELIRCLSSKKHDENALQLQFVEIAWNILKSLIDRSENPNVMPIEITSEMCDSLFKVFINGEDLEKATFMFKYIEKCNIKKTFIPESNILTDFCRLSAKHNRIENILNCVSFANAVGAQDVISELVNNRKQYKLSDELLQSMKLIESKDEQKSSKSTETETSSESSSESSDSSSED